MKFLNNLKRILNLFKPSKFNLLAFLFGSLSVLAFAPFYFSILSITSLSGLFWLWSKSNSKTDAFKTGLWFGLGLFGFGVSWVFSSIYIYSEVLLPIAIFLTFIFIFFLAIYIAFAGLLAHIVYKKTNLFVSLVVMYPAVWVVFEALRSNLFGGFPFLTMGNSFLGTWLDGYAPVFGVLGVSWILAISAGIFIWMLLQKRWLIGIPLIVILWLGGFYLQNIKWVVPFGKPVKVALVQGNIPQEKKWLDTELAPTLMKYISFTLENKNADIIVWPETAIPEHLTRVKSQFLKRLISKLEESNQDVISGVITSDKNRINYYNSIVNLRDTSQVYNKSHLVPFGEFFPFSGILYKLSEIFSIPFSQFSEGNKDFKTMKLANHNVGLAICFEASFAHELASYIPKASMIITISNDAWFTNTLEPHHQLQEVQMSALTLGREFARSTNTGFTAIIDTKGKIKKIIPKDKAAVLNGNLQPYKGTTPFSIWKNAPIFWLLGFIFAGYFLFMLLNFKALFKKIKQ